MKLTIKTLDRRSIVVDFDEQRTVGDLKKFLYDSKELTIQPELQNLIYSGKQLNNDEVLAKCAIDERRFLVVMAMKPKKPTETPNEGSSSGEKKSNEKPSEKTKSSTKPPTTKETDHSASSAPARIRAGSSSTITAPTTTSANSTTTPPVSSEDLSQNDALVQLLIEQMGPMGYSEADIRRALERSNNDSDVAIEYLINGIPEPQPATNPDFELVRQHPRFQELREELVNNPEMLTDVVTLLDVTNPQLAAMIRDNQDEFMRLLNESEPPPPPQGTLLEFNAADRSAVERLVAMGFDPESVLEAYIACDRNEEATADFLCHQFDED